MTAPLTPDLRAQLNAYLDFELSIEQEQYFFSQLAADSDLCARLHDLRGLRHESLRNGGVAMPPPDVTLGLFSSLGISATAHADRSPLPAMATIPLPARSGRRLVFPMAALVAWSAMIWFASREFTPADLPSVASLPAVETRTGPAVSPHGPSAHDAATAWTSSATRGAIGVESAAGTAVPEAPGVERTNPDAFGTEVASSTVGPADLAVSSPRDQNALPEAGNPSAPTNSDMDARTSPAQPAESPATPPAVTAADAAPPSVETPVLERGEIGGRSAVVEASLPRMDASPMAATPAQSGALSAQRQGGIAAYDGLSMPAGSTPHLSGLSLELRGFSTATFPSVAVESRSNPWLSEMAIALYYSAGQDAFGAEFGEEPWAQTYNGVEDGKAVRYEQNLMTSWLTANYRHTFEELGESGFEPYASAGVGVTFQRWPLMRAGLGLMYTADRRVRFHAGIDGSVLAYPFQETWFSSRKLGVTYGISVLM